MTTRVRGLRVSRLNCLIGSADIDHPESRILLKLLRWALDRLHQKSRLFRDFAISHTESNPSNLQHCSWSWTTFVLHLELSPPLRLSRYTHIIPASFYHTHSLTHPRNSALRTWRSQLVWALNASNNASVTQQEEIDRKQLQVVSNAIIPSDNRALSPQTIRQHEYDQGKKRKGRKKKQDRNL